ncbi:MAG TPA: hypothetical protein VG708_13760, partial [Mycobacteriales bacterium]|nr:hypothetical protein [Mycobacteriales bacterium]
GCGQRLRRGGDPWSNAGMAERFVLAGYDVGDVIADAAPAQVWHATHVASGEPVELLRLPAHPAVVARVRREADVLTAIDDPHLLAPREVIEADDALVVVTDAMVGRLARLLLTRDRLATPEAVTILAPLAGSLAAAHRHGVVHGDVDPSTIGFTAAGRPLLAAAGVAPALALAGPDDDAAAKFAPADDVHDLAAVGFRLLAGRAPTSEPDEPTYLATIAGEVSPLAGLAPATPPAVIAAIEAGLRAEPADRPDAAEFAAALLRASPTAPVRLVGMTPPPAPPPSAPLAPTAPPDPMPAAVAEPLPPAPPARPIDASSRRPIPRRLVIAAVAIGVLVAAVAVGAASARSHQPSAATLPIPRSTAHPTHPPATGVPSWTPPAAPHRPPAATWRRVVANLEAARAAAFDAADPGRLHAVYRSGVPGLAADRSRIDRLAARGERISGFTTTVQRARPLSRSNGHVRLRVVDRLSPYRIVDNTGRVVRRGRGRGARPELLQLVRTASGWRIDLVKAWPAARR